MNKTIFDVEDIYALRAQREAEYAQLGEEAAQRLSAQRADTEWNEITRLRALINDYYKCPNTSGPQPDRLPAPERYAA